MSGLAIIGIHGLLNKPEASVLTQWWRDALLEGLRKNARFNGELPPFDLAYWADVRNPEPISLDALDEPYTPIEGNIPFERYDRKRFIELREVLSKYGGVVVDKAKDLAGLGKSVELLLGVTLQDLAEYYEKETIRLAIRARLIDKIEANRGKDIFLIGHSMGSIIAYDVLRGYDKAPDLKIKQFVTIGSPLGLPYVSAKVRREFTNAITPICVDHWMNLADPKDKVAVDCKLADDYRPNEVGVGVEDGYIKNTYEGKTGKANNHKSYGYLRSPELSDLLASFVNR